ncbi:PEGA domain-containing protein [Candidatus Micrarchaeota archaeon]|nr:PEGA domain-containing protein [Candidatus Micrarchaeota archaeon]
MVFDDLYASLEEKYYGFMDYLQNDLNLPVYDKFITPIEEQGNPSFPYFLGILAILLLLIIGGGYFGAKTVAGNSPVTLQITVLGNDLPLEGAKIGMEYLGAIKEAQTDTLGIAKFSDLKKGEQVTVTASIEGFEEKKKTFKLSPNQNVKFELKGIEKIGEGSLKLTVLGESGIAISGAKIEYIDGSFGGTEFSDSQGFASLKVDGKSSVDISVSKTGYISELTTIDAGTNEYTVVLRSPNDDGGDIPIQRPRISISVKDEAGDEITASIKICYETSTCATPLQSYIANGGQLEVLDFEMGTNLKIIAQASKYKSQTKIITLDRDVLYVSFVLKRQGIEFENKTYITNVSVFDNETMLPLPAYISIFEKDTNNFVVKSETQVEFAEFELGDGDYFAIAENSNFIFGKSGYFRSGEFVNLYLKRRTSANSKTVGILTTNENNAGVSAYISFFDLNGAIVPPFDLQTDSTGRKTIFGMPVGKYVLKASTPGGLRGEMEINVGNLTNFTLQLKLAKSKLKLTVLDNATGTGIQRFNVSHVVYSRGDVNNDSKVDYDDLTYLVNYVGSRGPAPIPLVSGDINGNGPINVVDVTYFINYLQKNGPEPYNTNKTLLQTCTDSPCTFEIMPFRNYKLLIEAANYSNGFSDLIANDTLPGNETQRTVLLNNLIPPAPGNGTQYPPQVVQLGNIFSCPKFKGSFAQGVATASCDVLIMKVDSVFPADAIPLEIMGIDGKPTSAFNFEFADPLKRFTGAQLAQCFDFASTTGGYALRYQPTIKTGCPDYLQPHGNKINSINLSANFTDYLGKKKAIQILIFNETELPYGIVKAIDSAYVPYKEYYYPTSPASYYGFDDEFYSDLRTAYVLNNRQLQSANDEIRVQSNGGDKVVATKSQNKGTAVGFGFPASSTATYFSTARKISFALPTQITLTIDPIGSDIYVDGEFRRTTTISTTSVGVTPGDHELLVRKAGFYDYTIGFIIKSSETLYYTINLNPLPTGTLAVSASNKGPVTAEIRLDNTYQGLTPKTIANVLAGNHILTLDAPGYLTKSLTVNIIAGAINTQNVDLTPVPIVNSTSCTLGETRWCQITVSGQNCNGEEICNSEGTWGNCADITTDNCPTAPAPPPVCYVGNTTSCTTNSSGQNCPGTSTCTSAQVWGTCNDIANDNCPTVIPPQLANYFGPEVYAFNSALNAKTTIAKLEGPRAKGQFTVGTSIFSDFEAAARIYTNTIFGCSNPSLESCANSKLPKGRLFAIRGFANTTAFKSAFRRSVSQGAIITPALDLETGSPMKYFSAAAAGFSFSGISIDSGDAVFNNIKQFTGEYAVAFPQAVPDACKVNFGLYQMTATSTDFGSTWAFSMKPLQVAATTRNGASNSYNCPAVTACNLFDAYEGSNLIYSDAGANHCFQFEWPIVPTSNPDLRSVTFGGVSSSGGAATDSFILNAPQNTSLVSAAGVYNIGGSSGIFNEYNIANYPDVFN